MRLLKYGLFGLLIVFFLFVIVAGVGTGTNAGSNWLIKNVGHALGGELEIERIEGHLLDELSLHNVRYRSGELTANAAQIKWAWQPSALFRGLLRINRIELQNVTLILPPSDTPPPPNDTPFEMPEIRLPITVQIEELAIQQFTLHHTTNQDPFIIEYALLEARIDQQLHIQQFQIKTPEFNSELELAGQFDLLRPHSLALTAKARADLPEAPATTLQLNAQGQLDAIQTEIKLDGNWPLTLQANIDAILTDPKWKISVLWDALNYPIDTAEYSLKNGKINANGDLNTYQMSSQFIASGAQIPTVEWQLKGTGDLQHFRLEELLGKLPQGDLHLKANIHWLPELQADFNLTAKKLAIAEYWPPELPAINAQIKGLFANEELRIEHLQVDLPNQNTLINAKAEIKLNNPTDPNIKAELNWLDLRWPPTGTALANLPKGQANFQGTPNAYQLTVETAFTGQDIPKSQINLIAKGSTTEAKLEALKIQLLKGQINAQGNVQWLPHVKWNLAVNGQQIKPEQQWPEFPGTLALKLNTEGQITDHLQAQLELTQLKGELRGYPLDLTMIARANGDRYQIEQLKFRSGENQLTAKADYQQQLNAEWTLEMRRLAALLPNAQGQLSSKGTISGNPQSPHIKAHIKGEKLGFNDLKLQQLALDVETNLSNPNNPLNLNLLVKQLQQADEVLLTDASIVGTGSIKQHQFKLNAKSPMQDIALQLNGGLNLEKLDWQGQLQELQVKFKETLAKAGEWQLQKASPLFLNGKEIQARLQDFCLRQKNNNTEFCLSAQHDSKSSQLDFNLKELSLNLITPDLTGTIKGELKANYHANGKIAANGQFRVSPGAFVTEVEGRRQQLAHEGGTLELSVNETGLSSQLDFKLLQHSALQGQLRLPGFNRIPMSEQQTLEAQLKGDIGDLALVSVFVPMLEEVKGKLSLNLSANGLLKQPLIQGNVRLTEAQLNVPLLGMELRDLYANINSDSDTLGLLKIELGARSGDGNLSITGQANPLLQQVDLTLQGEQFRLLNNVDAFVLISPNINVKIKEENVNITGTLTIPEANITPNMVVSDGSTSVGGVVRSSQDAVIINDPNVTEESQILGIAEKLKLSMNLLVKLGDNIHVDAVGFKSQIKGQIRLTNRPQDIELLPTANGELQIINGTFRSYGQDLEIDRGRVIFANTLVTKPELNIKAIRRIYGDQKVEAVGIHITGNPEKINLDLFSQPLVPQDQIISYLLTGKSFDSNNPDHTIGWGTYILPNLYISYGISLLNQSNIFTVRYELNKTWGVEINIAEEDKGIDFSYTLER
jgi:translocation and assembly module TamB